MASPFINRLRFKLFGSIRLMPKAGPIKGNVLLSYSAFAFCIPADAPDTHTSYWECRDMAAAFLERGYVVDVMDWANKAFMPPPKRQYDVLIDIHSNLERLAPLVGPKCVKVLHITGAYWKFQNEAELRRLAELKARRGVALAPRRQVSPSRGIEIADAATLLLGSDFVGSTYAAVKPPRTILHGIPISTSHTYPSPEGKDFAAARRRFVWFGGAGMVHKGLDLLLEAFAGMPELELAVCGPVANEKDFADAYRAELYETPNIALHGKVDPAGDVWEGVVGRAAAIIYPSCSEGASGSVIVAMHAGLVPIVSREASVDIGDFGALLEDCSVEGIRRAVRAFAALPPDEIGARALGAWKHANAHHSRASFAAAYRAFIDSLKAIE